MEELLTVKETAEVLRLRPSTIYAYAEKGILPYTKLGNRLLFQKSRLEDWVEANSHPGRTLRDGEAKIRNSRGDWECIALPGVPEESREADGSQGDGEGVRLGVSGDKGAFGK